MSGLFLGGDLAPAGTAISFLHAPGREVVRMLGDWRTGLGRHLETRTGELADASHLLEPFEGAWTRELLFDCGEWTAYMNNSISGGDPTSAAPYLSNVMKVDEFTAIHTPMHGPGHASTQLWVKGPSGTPPLMDRRSISAYAQDGRWSWRTFGEPLPFEHPERYEARRVRDRFDRPLLIEYLDAVGIRADDRGFYGRGTVVQQIVSFDSRKESAEQVRARLGM